MPSGPWYCPTCVASAPSGVRSRAYSRSGRSSKTSRFPRSDFHISSLLITEHVVATTARTLADRGAGVPALSSDISPMISPGPPRAINAAAA